MFYHNKTIMAGHEPEKNEITSPVERLHNDIKNAIKRDQTISSKEEKDCTDQLLECTTQCDPDDKECEEECVEQYKECEIEWSDKVVVYPVKETDLVAEIEHIATLLNGTTTKLITCDSSGRESKKIVVEYAVTNKKVST